jgi:hypothetical protein
MMPFYEKVTKKSLPPLEKGRCEKIGEGPNRKDAQVKKF